MQPSTISWANLVKLKSGLDNRNNWPTIAASELKPGNKNLVSNKICLVNKNSLSVRVEEGIVLNPTENEDERTSFNKNIVQDVETALSGLKISENRVLNPNLKQGTDISDKKSTTETIIENITAAQNEKSREQILEARKARKLLLTEEKARRKLEEKINQIRAPKSEKLKIIDNKLLEKYINSSKQSKSLNEIDSSAKITTKNRVKRKLKIQTVTLSLAELIQNNRVKSNKSIEKIQKVKIKTIQRRKGKTREFPKKCLTTLKRNILIARKLKKELTEKVEETQKPIELVIPSKIRHSRKFRPYCDHLITPELCTSVENMLCDIFRFQKRAFEKNEVKSRARKRFVVGFREVKRDLCANKLKIILIAPDLEPNSSIDDAVQELKDMAQKLEIPYVFSIGRYKIGYIMLKKGPVSCVGVLNYDGSDENYKNIVKFIEIERENYLKNC